MSAESPDDLPRHVSHFDPSWCARINAHRRAPQPSADPPAAVPEPAPASGPEAAPPSTASAPPVFKLREIPKEHVCEMCGTVMYDHNCKIVCPNCGYKRDCSDP